MLEKQPANSGERECDAESQVTTTLLSGLCKPKETARFEASWGRFHGKYARIIARWCQSKWGLRANAADDVAADVMLRILRAMKNGKYKRKGRFRGWIYTITRNAVVDYWETENRHRHGCDESVLANVEARKDLAKRLQEEFDLELLVEAQRRAREQVSVRDWDIFVALTERGEKPVDVGVRHGMERNAVYTTKRRVLLALQNELQTLEANGIEP